MNVILQNDALAFELRINDMGLWLQSPGKLQKSYVCIIFHIWYNNAGVNLWTQYSSKGQH